MVKFLIMFLRVLAVIVLVPLIIILTLNALTPGILMAVVSFVNELQRLPMWGNWLILAASLVLLGVALIPMIAGRSGKQDEQEGDSGLLGE